MRQLNTTPKKTICLEVRDDSPFEFGTKVYVIQPDHYSDKTFSEKCPLCEGTKEVTLKEFTFKCPVCQGSTIRPNVLYLTVHDFTVKEYIINRCEIVGRTYKNIYAAGTLDDNNLPYIRWYGFAKRGNNSQDVQSREFSVYDLKVSDLEKQDSQMLHGGLAFLSKKEAEAYCKGLHELQKKLLDKFNLEHGTSHEYPFE